MVVLITGASGGLGGVVVRSFLDNGAAAVYGVARSWKKDEGSADRRFHRIEADVLQESECRRAVEQADAADVLVHLVGGFAGGKPLAESEDDIWNQMLNVNLLSAVHRFRAVLPRMMKAGRGRLIAVGSRAAFEPMANFAAYSTAKAALVAMVKTVAQEVKDSGITANVVLPSIIDTPANRSAMPKADHSKWVTPESIGHLLVWLASAEASDVSGAAIPIYGRA